MNTEILLAAEGEPGGLQAGFAAARSLIEASEARFTRFSETSELAHLNAASGAWFNASPEMYALLEEAYGYFKETDGLFDPSVLPALERAGYDRSLEQVQARAGEEWQGAAEPTLTRARLEIEFDAARRRVRLGAGVRIDLGGIAKGWIAERAAGLLGWYSTACAVNAGGDLDAVGVPAGESGWQVGLEDPRDPDRTLALLRVGPGAVATSSVAKRRWVQAGNEQHHLIDPRTGLPADTDWLSVTAVAAQAATAEVWAKALLIGGSREADRLLRVRKDLDFIAVGRDGQLYGSEGAKALLEHEVSEVGLELQRGVVAG